MIEGTVGDALGRPLADVEVRLVPKGDALGGEVTNTDSVGHYLLPTPPKTATFDPDTDDVEVVVAPQAYAPDGNTLRYQVYVGEQVPAVHSDPFRVTQSACRRDFHAGALEPNYTLDHATREIWPDVVELYQRTWRAWTLADLEFHQTLDYGLPLRIYGWCSTAAPRSDGIRCPNAAETAAQYIGSTSTAPNAVAHPYIAIRPASSDRSASATILYHEFGHAFMADAFGNATPTTSGTVTAHAGYYVNVDSNDSWTEGFADFYALMVSKHIDGRHDAHLDYVDMEADIPAWQGNGQDEPAAVASLLLDLEDGKDDYEPNRVPMLVTLVDRVPDGSATLIYAEGNRSMPDGVPVTGVVFDAAGRRVGQVSGNAGRRNHLVPEVELVFRGDAGEINPGDYPTRVKVTANLGGRGVDDDPLAIGLEPLWQAIVSSRTTDTAYPYPKTMWELYLALADRDDDLDGDGRGEVTNLFIRHGFFADLAGGKSDRAFSTGEDVGRSSHVAFGKYPAMPDRQWRPTPPAELATVDVGGADARILVQIVYPDERNDLLGYGYTATPDAAGRIQIAPPPAGSGAQVIVLAVADGFQSVILGTLEANAFWKDVERNDGRTFLHYAAVLAPAAPVPTATCAFARDCTPSTTTGPVRSGPDPLLIVIGLLVVALIAVSAIAAVAIRRRRGSVMVGGGGAFPTGPAGYLGGPPPTPSGPAPTGPPTTGPPPAVLMPTRPPRGFSAGPPPAGPPPAQTPAAFVTAAAGMPAWATPDASVAPIAQLPPGLPVVLLETTPAGWARVGTSNGWSGWVDGRLLVRTG